MADRRFFGRAWASLGSTRNVFGKLCLLALLQFVPVLGQIVTFGYFLGWVREAAWGMETPMPAHVLSGGDRHFWPRGAKAWVTSILYGLIMSALIVGLVAVWLFWGHWQPGLLDDVILGVLVAVGTAGTILLVVIYYMGLVRLSIYNRFGAAWQWGACLRMAGSDFGGLLKLFFGSFGLYLLVSAIVGLIAALVGVLLSVSFAWSAFAGLFGSLGDVQSIAYALLAVMGSLLVALPILLALSFLIGIPYLVISAVCWRALGNWAAGLNVPVWGAMSDPLPAPAAEGVAPGADETTAPAGAEGAPASPIADATVEQAATASATAAQAVVDAAATQEVSDATVAQAAAGVPTSSGEADAAAVAPAQVEQAAAARQPTPSQPTAQVEPATQAQPPVAQLSPQPAVGHPASLQSCVQTHTAQASQAGATAPQPQPVRRSHPVGVIVLCLLGALIGCLLVCLLVNCVAWAGSHSRYGSVSTHASVSSANGSSAEGTWRTDDGQTVTLKKDRTFTWQYDRSGDSYVTGSYTVDDLGSELPESVSDLLAGTGLDELLDVAGGVGIDPSLFGICVYELRLTADGGVNGGIDASLDVKGITLDVLLVVSGDRALLVDLSSLDAGNVQDAILEAERS